MSGDAGEPSGEGARISSAARTEGLAAREAWLLAPYAMRSAASAGRKYPEPPHPYRSPFARDRDRIVHSAAFRRLAYKTQVFTGELGDYHRSRLTHTLEATSIARTIGRASRLNEDFIEALALVHDIGHPPFGHSGEEVLDGCLREFGGFSHNRQALRIVEHLERRYPAFAGLNLSQEVLEGQAVRANKMSPDVRTPWLEAQVVDAADSIAYDTHDADDALELGLLTLDDLLAEPLWSEAADRVRRRYAALAATELRRAVLHELIDWQVGDLLARTTASLADLHIDSVAAVRSNPRVVQPSAELAEKKVALEKMLHGRVYRHPQVLRMRSEAQAALGEMFAGYCARPELLPEKFRGQAEQFGLERSTADYLAGMTDRFALREHARLFENG
jgi:dGTPase